MFAALLCGFGLSGKLITTEFYTADPAPHVWPDGKLYIYADRDLSSKCCADVDQYHVFSTSDMENFKDEGEILRASQVPWGASIGAPYMWAPDAQYRNGTYYLYFPHPAQQPWNSNWRIGVATSSSPTKNFKVVGYIRGTPSKFDPAVFIDNDGEVSFYMGGDNILYSGKLKPNMVELDGQMKQVTGLTSTHEAPWLHKRNGTYYLSYAYGASGGDKMAYATSDHPLGPWKFRGYVLDKVSSQSSHGGIVEFKGQWWIVYHNSELSRRNGNKQNWLRSVTYDKLFYNADGTIQQVVQTNA
jgi:beta-xylosidase